jgi:hypothetical protein
VSADARAWRAGNQTARRRRARGEDRSGTRFILVDNRGARTLGYIEDGRTIEVVLHVSPRGDAFDG